MGGECCRVMVVSADAVQAEALMGAARFWCGAAVRRVRSIGEARALWLDDPAAPELLIASVNLPDGDATDLLEPVGGRSSLPLLVLLPDSDLDAAREALARGALEVLYPSDLSPAILGRALERARRAWSRASALRQAEGELREERNRLELVSRSLGVGLVTISRDYRTLWANSVVTETFGDVVGRHCYEAYQRRESVCPGCGARKVFEGEQVRVVYEEPHIDARGTPVWFEIVAAPLEVVGGQVQTVMELSLRADARKQAEEALRNSEARYRALSQEFRAILDAVPDTLVQVSPDLEILWANRGAAQGVGQGLGGLVGRRCHDVWDCDAVSCEECPVQACLRSGRIEELCAFTADGRAWDRRAAPVRDETGAFRGAVEVARDVTAQRRDELERVVLVRDLQKKNELLEQFIHTASHDLKGPVTTIRGFLSLLARDLEGRHVDRAKAHADRIGTAARWMQELLDALLNYSRAGSSGLNLEPISLGQLAREVLDAHAVVLANRAVQVVVDPDLPAVWGDRVRLREVLENLVGNALKFLVDQPSPKIEIGQRPGKPGPVFFVRDNGVGIEPEQRDHIFGLFQKLDPRAEGTGVGLAIVRRVLEAHGGRVWVESEGRGKGSSFCFTLGAEAAGSTS